MKKTHVLFLSCCLLIYFSSIAMEDNNQQQNQTQPTTAELLSRIAVLEAREAERAIKEKQLTEEQHKKKIEAQQHAENKKRELAAYQKRLADERQRQRSAFRAGAPRLNTDITGEIRNSFSMDFS